MRLVNKKHYIIAISQSVSIQRTGRRASFTGMIGSIGGDRVRRLFLLMVLLAFVGAASATDYYVNNSWVGASDSNDGLADSNTSAWLTIQKAADTLVGGDTVHVIGGSVYSENVSEWTSGSSGNCIVYQGVNSPVIDADGGTAFKLQSGASYINITGFNITDFLYGVWLHDDSDANPFSYNNISYNYFVTTRTSSAAILFQKGNYTKIIGNEIYMNINNAKTIDMDNADNWHNDIEDNILNRTGEESDNCGMNGNYNNFINNTIKGGRNGFGGGTLNHCNISYNDVDWHEHNGLNLHSTTYSVLIGNKIWRNLAGPSTSHSVYIEGTYWIGLNHDNRFKDLCVNNWNSADGAGSAIYNSPDAYNLTFDNISIDSPSQPLMFLARYRSAGDTTFKNITINTTSANGMKFDGYPYIESGGANSSSVGNVSIINVSFMGNTETAFRADGTFVQINGVISIINSNNDTVSWTAGGTGGEFVFYYPLSVRVVDTIGSPISDATITIECNTSGFYTRDFMPETNGGTPNILLSMTTDSYGYSPLPWGNETTSIAVPYKKVNKTTTIYTGFNISVSKSGYNTNNTLTDQSVNNTWYRADMNTHQNVTTVILSGGDQWSPSDRGIYWNSTNPIMITTKTNGINIFNRAPTKLDNNATSSFSMKVITI